MARWRSRELEAILGAPLDEAGLTEAILEGLTIRGERESELLDFKSDTYVTGRSAGKNWLDDQEFAKDVCALANHRGGLLLIGVKAADDAAASLSPLSGVTTEGEERRLRQLLGRWATPVVDLFFLPVTSEQENKFYMGVVVPPSARAPHAVLGHPGDARRPLHFPVRDGSDTRWMSENEVADRYRQRSLFAVERRAREEEVVNGGHEMLEWSTGLWLYMAAIPALQVDAVLDAEAVRSAQEWVRNPEPESPLGQSFSLSGTPFPAPGRTTFTSHPYKDGQEPSTPREGYLDLHVTGPVFAATEVTSKSFSGAADHELGRRTLVDCTILLADTCLRWVAGQVGEWGDVVVVAGIHEAGRPSGQLSVPLELLASSGWGEPRRIANTRRVGRSPHVRVAADMSQTSTLTGRLVAAHRVASGLLQWFGVPEISEISADGAMRYEAWGDRRLQVEQWVQRRSA